MKTAAGLIAVAANNMFDSILQFIETRSQEFHLISGERKKILDGMSDFIRSKTISGQTADLVYVCTHNARRSHFGQVAAALAADYFRIVNVHSFSGGMEVTEFHPNAIQALERIGFKVKANMATRNPHYQLNFGAPTELTCFSKQVDHIANPGKGFLAVMVCSEADKNCPFVPNAAKRISTPYADPKDSDGTAVALEVYTERFAQILRETLYAFSQVKQ